jgi:hypothetical protein
MSWSYTYPVHYVSRALLYEKRSDSIVNAKFFPYTRIEYKARSILQKSYDNDPYLASLAKEIQSLIDQLDVFRETGFCEHSTEYILSYLETVCALF